MKKALTILASLTASTLATAALAEPESVTVSYRDLNLSVQAGVDELDRRLRAAIGEVCDERLEQIPLWERVAIRKCVHATWQDVEGPRRLAIARERSRMFEPSVLVGQAEPPEQLLQVASKPR